MISLRSLRVGPRLALAFGSVITAFVVLAVLSGHQVYNMAASNHLLANKLLAERDLALRWSGEVEKNLVRTHVVLSTSDFATSVSVQASMKQTTKNVDELQAKAEKLFTEPEEAKALAKVIAARKAYSTARKEAMAAKEKGDVSGVTQAIVSKVYPTAESYKAALAEVVALSEAVAAAAIEKAEADADRSLKIQASALLALALVAGVLAWRIRRSITGPLVAVNETLNAMAVGNLAMRADVQGNDELTKVSLALNQAATAMAATLDDVQRGADSVRVATQEIAAGNSDLSSRTEAQAASLQQSAAAVEELTVTMQNNVSMGHTAKATAESAQTASLSAHSTVESVIETMGRIEDASKKVGEVVGIINDIAFQTNLLALNAAVEAARAGQQGRGFAVVAGEVRRLSARSADAAKEIKTIVQATLDEVALGSKAANSAGAAMQEATKNVECVQQLVAQMAVSTAEQAKGIEEINASVAQLDTTTQQNAALVEESAAAAESLREQAQRLHGAVAQFTLS